VLAYLFNTTMVPKIAYAAKFLSDTELDRVDRDLWTLFAATSRCPLNTGLEARVMPPLLGGLKLWQIRMSVTQRNTKELTMPALLTRVPGPFVGKWLSVTRRLDSLTAKWNSNASFFVSLWLAKRPVPVGITIVTREKVEWAPLPAQFHLSSLVLHGLAWGWQHGYAAPKGWPPYFRRIPQRCSRCLAVHDSTFFAALFCCKSRHAWRCRILSSYPGCWNIRALYNSLREESRKLLLRGRLSLETVQALLNSSPPAALSEDELATALRRSSLRLLMAVKQVLAEAAADPLR
jgi:hypothetical protein